MTSSMLSSRPSRLEIEREKAITVLDKVKSISDIITTVGGNLQIDINKYIYTYSPFLGTCQHLIQMAVAFDIVPFL